MRASTRTFYEVSHPETDFRIRFWIFVSLLFYVTAFMAVGYLVFWKPLLSRWIF